MFYTSKKCFGQKLIREVICAWGKNFKRKGEKEVQKRKLCKNYDAKLGAGTTPVQFLPKKCPIFLFVIELYSGKTPVITEVFKKWLSIYHVTVVIIMRKCSFLFNTKPFYEKCDRKKAS